MAKKVKNIKDLEENYNLKAINTVKTLIYKGDDKFYAALVKGDNEVNESKLKKLLKLQKKTY